MILIQPAHNFCDQFNISSFKIILLLIEYKSSKKFGFDRINFGFVKKNVPQFLANNPAVTDSIRNQIETQLQNADVTKMDLLRLIQLELIKRGSK